MRKLFWIVSAIVFCSYSCTKIETTTIGSGLIPPVDGVTTLETELDVISENIPDAALNAIIAYKSNDQVIGVINNDPLFGTTTAKAFFELKPTFYKFFLPNKAELTPDSAVLILSYKGVWGNENIPQTWEVKEVTETIQHDSAYRLSKTFETGRVLGTANVQISSAKDSVINRFEKANNQIRIKLDAATANKFMKQYDSTNAYLSDSLFRSSFKGFAVGPVAGSGGNALVRVNLSDTNTKFALYYKYHIKDSPATKMDTAVTYLRFSTGAGASVVSGSNNYINRIYTGSDVAAAWQNTAPNDASVYIQSSPGTLATIKIPGLDTLSNRIIHRAELIAVQQPESSGLHNILTPPSYLLLSYYDSDRGIKRNIPNDFIISQGLPNITTFGGFPINKDVTGVGIVKSYVFDMSRYVQGIVTRGDTNYTLRLSAPVNDSLLYTEPYPLSTTTGTFYFRPAIANNLAVGRVRLGGGALPASNPVRMRLRIIYSRL